MKLDKIIKIYLNSLKCSIKEKTYLFYNQIVDIYIEKQDFDLLTLNNDQLNDFVICCKKRLSGSTVKILKSLINRSLKYAYLKGYTDKQFLISIKISQQKTKSVKALNEKEEKKLENYIIENNKFYHYGILISLYTGLRIGELLSLEWKDIDFKNKLLFVRKTVGKISVNHKTKTILDLPKTESSMREMPLSKNLTAILKELKVWQQSKSNYVITNKRNKPLDIRTYQQSFSNILKKLNIQHYGFHSLRHTFATRLLENRVDIKTISELMGHSSPTITLNRYVHTNMNNKRKAIENLTKKRQNF